MLYPIRLQGKLNRKFEAALGKLGLRLLNKSFIIFHVSLLLLISVLILFTCFINNSLLSIHYINILYTIIVTKTSVINCGSCL